MAIPQVVVPIDDRVARRAVQSEQRDIAWRVVAVMGAMLGVVGWIDLGLLYVPQRFGNAQWEFGTISATFNALPLATLSTAALVTASLFAGWRRWVGVLTMFVGLVTLLLVGLTALYVLDIPVLLQGATPEIRPILLKSIAKTSAFALVYVAAYVWLGLACWRTLRTTR